MAGNRTEGDLHGSSRRKCLLPDGVCPIRMPSVWRSNMAMAAMDAVHIAVALEAKADEFVSAEKPNKPMFRVTEIATVSLWRELQ